MKVLQGDLLKLALAGTFDVIVHGCNCYCRMGKGIAKEIRTQFPEAFAADRRTTPGDRTKLGTITWAEINRESVMFVVVNAYTQFDWRGRGVKADYHAIVNAMHALKSQFAGMRIGYPKIGAGLAGGDWNIVAQLIDAALAGEDHTLVELPQ